jgi:hypothetical protein
MTAQFAVFRQGGKIYVRFQGQEKKIAVRPVWPRPTATGGEISLLDESRKEVVRVERLESLDIESRKILESALEENYLIPVIQDIFEIRAHMGLLYWSVRTSAGDRRFALKDPCENVLWLSDDRLVIRDSSGNRYEIESLSAMSLRSRSQISLVI